jgi:hypothetical protein
MAGLRFDYNRFYNYYTDPRNVVQDVSQTIRYYHRRRGQRDVLHHGYTGDTYITVGGTKYYITADPSKRDILFTLPTIIPGQTGQWSFHYHFGVGVLDECRNVSVVPPGQTNIPFPAVYFHKTIQDPVNKKYKDQKNCYFKTDELIDDAIDLLSVHCLESSKGRMANRPDLARDINVIQEIIRRPFYGPRYGGGHRRTKKSRCAERRTRRQRPV